MRSTAILASMLGALVVLTTTTTFAQEMTRDQLNQRPQTMQEQQSSGSMKQGNDSSQGGVQSGTSEGGTLMQKREQGMAPDAKKNDGGGATIKQ